MYIRLLLTAFAFIVFSTALSAQTDTLPPDFTFKGMAIGISNPEMIDQMMAVMPGLGSNAKAMMNEQSVKSYLMPPREVGQRGTSTSYLLSACMEFYTNFRKNYKVNLSPDFVTLSLAREGNQDLKNALRFLVTDGTVSADIMPYDSPSIPRSAGATDKYRITNYLQIFRETHRDAQKVFEVQKALMRGNPVIVEMKTPDGFEKITDTRFWSSLGKDFNNVLPFMVVGYNLELEAFEVLSAWGPEWGSDGYLWVDFDDFGEIAQNGYVMVPAGQ
ncbi:MAG: C1 family peptidase [Lewinellaceae bacterium]|nr:C1 family peptidase [Saprospiraceae bacterium]MCB9340749.1 C1 family peptidase [Lewinellaceae bacterium]